MSKKILTSQAAHGQPLTAPTGLDHLQTSYAEGFAQTLIGLIGLSYDINVIYKLWGADYSISIGGQLTNTAGAVFYQGEIFLVDAVPTGGVTITDNVNMTLNTTYADGAGTEFEDGFVANILAIRKMAYANNATANIPVIIGEYIDLTLTGSWTNTGTRNLSYCLMPNELKFAGTVKLDPVASFPSLITTLPVIARPAVNIVQYLPVLQSATNTVVFLSLIINSSGGVFINDPQGILAGTGHLTISFEGLSFRFI